MVSGPARSAVTRRGQPAGLDPRWMALEPYRVVVPASFVALWVGFSLLVYAHPMVRVPMTVTLAALIGVGAELCARGQGRVALGRMAEGTLWIIPAGATIVIGMLLTSVGPRLAVCAPLLAAAVVGALCLQALETNATNPALSWTRSVNTGLAFALAFAVFAFLPGLDTFIAMVSYALVGTLVALVVLRGCRASNSQLAAYVAVTAVLIVELGLMLQDTRPPFLAAGVPLLGLYAVSTTAQAILDRAPRRAYLEVALVTGLALVIVAFSLNRR